MRTVMLITALAAFPALALAQPRTGSGSGTLSERTHYVAFFHGRPPDASIELLIVLRGQPGWHRAGGVARAGASAPSRTGPVRYSLEIGAVRFECAYDPVRRILTNGENQYALDSTNVIIVDRVDGIGGAPMILHRMSLHLPPYFGGPDAVRALEQIPDLQEFLR